MEVYARYGSRIRMPFDIMPGLSAKSWAGKDPKTIAQVLTEIAVITANGGRWNIGEFPTGREHPVVERLKDYRLLIVPEQFRLREEVSMEQVST